MSDLGEQIVTQARTYLSVPYFHAGRTREGLDCIGLLAVVAHDLGITDYDDVNYQPDPPAEPLTHILNHFCLCIWARETSPDWPQPFAPGDLLQFEILGVPRHAGIYATDEQGSPMLIHAYQAVGKVIEHPFDAQWRRRLWAVYRVKEK